MAETLDVQLRDETGRRAAKRLRKQGRIPAILYGHGQENVSLSVSIEEIEKAVRHGGRFVNLAGQVSDSALIAELQWNTWGTEVLHVDFHRVSAEERVEVRVAVELRGEAPGVKQGGVVEQLVHELDIVCPANAVPEHITVRLLGLELNATITAGQVELPAGATLVGDASVVVVQCMEPAAEAEEAGPVEGGAVEPELIRRKREEEEES